MPPLTMPKMLYGTAWKKERTTELVVEAIKAGFRGIDTACQPKHYREDLVGKALAALIAEGVVKREEIFLQTKYATSSSMTTAAESDMEKLIRALFICLWRAGLPVEQSLTTSLKNLGVEYIDSVVLHSPLHTREQTLQAYRTLESLHDQGKIRSLGVSNIYDPPLLEWLIKEARVKVGVVQNRWYEGNGWDWEIYDICQAHSIRYQSFWTLTGSPTLLKHPHLIRLAGKYGLTPEQTVYKLAQLWNITPLCGSTTPSHINEALAAEGSESLSADTPEVVQLWQAMHR